MVLVTTINPVYSWTRTTFFLSLIKPLQVHTHRIVLSPPLFICGYQLRELAVAGCVKQLCDRKKQQQHTSIISISFFVTGNVSHMENVAFRTGIFKDIFWDFCAFISWIGQLRSRQETGEREGMTCGKGPQGRCSEDKASEYGKVKLISKILDIAQV